MSTKPIIHPLKRWLFEHQMTLAAFQADTGICIGYLSDITTWKKKPSADIMVRIRTATNGDVTPNDLLP
jgi:hypothetical protein